MVRPSPVFYFVRVQYLSSGGFLDALVRCRLASIALRKVVALEKTAAGCRAFLWKMNKAGTNFCEDAAATAAEPGFEPDETFRFAEIGRQFCATREMIHFSVNAKMI